MSIAIALGLIALLAALHGALIVWMPPDRDWIRTVRWYRRSKAFSWFVPIALTIVAIVAISANGVPLGYPLTSLIRRFVEMHPYISGTLIVSLIVAVVIICVEQLWVNPVQRASTRPGGIWYLWFVVTFGASLLVVELGQAILPAPMTTLPGLAQVERDAAARPSAAAGSPEHKALANIIAAAKEAAGSFDLIEQFRNSRGDDMVKLRAQLVSKRELLENMFGQLRADEAGPSVPAETQQIAGHAAALVGSTTRLIRAALSGWTGFGAISLLIVGGLYGLWTASLLYRRVTETDRLVGKTATSLAFLPAPHSQHPVQSVVVGPRFSGKTELLRSIQGVEYPANGKTEATTVPVSARLHSKKFDISLIDCGGEYVGDQLDLLANLRTDCLVVVLCAAHLTGDATRLAQVHNWSLNRVATLINPLHDFVTAAALPPSGPGSTITVGSSCAAFLQAIYYATNRTRRASPQNGRDPAAEVARVIVVLNHRDAVQTGGDPSQYDTIPLHCLEALAKSIYQRFVRPGQPPEAESAAAIKVRLTLQPTRNVTVDTQSNVLTRNDNTFIGWASAMAGDWHVPAAAPTAAALGATNPHGAQS